MIKKAISLPEDVYNSGAKKTKKMFGGNFSKYICYLISKDRESMDAKPKQIIKDSKIMNAIDDILKI